MNHIKLIVLGIVLVVGIVFGTIFWDNFKVNQQEIANMPLGDTGTDMSTPQDNLTSLEMELDSTNLEQLDAETADMETELSGL